MRDLSFTRRKNRHQLNWKVYHRILYQDWLITSWPKVERIESHSSPYMRMQFKSLRDYAESLKLITLVVFLFRKLKTVSQWRLKNWSAVICYLRLKGSAKEVQQPKTSQLPQTKVEKAPSGPQKDAAASPAVPKAGQSTCPLCKVELNFGSKEPPNHNTCTECKNTVCNQCGFNPMPNVSEVIKTKIPKLKVTKMYLEIASLDNFMTVKVTYDRI